MTGDKSAKLVPIRQDPILERPSGVGFAPEEIIWCRYKFEFKNSPTPGVMQLEFTNKVYCYPIPSGEDSERFGKAFAGAVALGLEPDPNLEQPRLDPLLYKSSDVGVTKQCYVIIELHPALNWRFINYDGGLTTDGAYQSGNCTLRHVARDGSSECKVYPDECRVLYFELVARDKFGDPNANHKFNFHIELINGDFLTVRTYGLGVIVDPDIGNTGNVPIP